MQYSAGDQYGFDNIRDDADWDEFISRMMALAREGYVVTIHNNSVSNTSTKESITFTTDDENEADAWAKEKLKEGYTVIIDFDDKIGIYTCTAVK